MENWTDPILDEIHAVREELAREADNDLHKLVLRLEQSQQRHGAKLVTRTLEKPAGGLEPRRPPP